MKINDVVARIILAKSQHCMKSVQMQNYFWSVFSCIRTEYGDLLRKFSPNTGKNGPEITLYADTFQAVQPKPH